ncbi:glycosyl hydrolase [Exophiala viscosa]|uniref:glycosyl hydrolase n=1 Tax=Exophiala viscosa TaxID=2486360 RepID=UPI00219ED0D8|nr:glycosyl hydrolase [Exophiala viscosa]
MHDSASKRPVIHFTAQSWINDPCGPGYDPITGLYHLFYQWNPDGCDWGNMSWGHIQSRDMISWEEASMQPALFPSRPYDKEGIFTGCLVPAGSGIEMTIFYSSVKHLPFHWSTPPYPRNAAGLSMATSHDGGATWQKSENNPILEGEPAEMSVTGFRDPFVSAWPALDRLRGEQALYGLISGGVTGAGPTTFLYAVEPERLGKWKYLGPLVDIPARKQSSEKWSGNFGTNWECVNFVTLQSDSVSRDFLIIGAEGDVERKHILDGTLPPGLPARTIRQNLWMSGYLDTTVDAVKFHPTFDGFLDHGCYYAANSFVDSRSGRRILYGWIPEEDCSLDYAHEKGWNGSLAVPREIFLLKIDRVTRALRSPLHEISSMSFVEDHSESLTLITLGIRPFSEMSSIRENCRQARVFPQFSLPSLEHQSRHLCRTSHSAWSLQTVVAVSTDCDSVALYIRHNEDLSIRTTIIVSLVEETITVERTASSLREDVNKCPEQGPFTLFEAVDHHGERHWEKLHLDIVSDGDVLEIFANNRFALATMVYSGDGVANCGITACATGLHGSASFESTRIFDGLNGMKPLFS